MTEPAPVPPLQTMPTTSPYDFYAADNLRATLQTASRNLSNFLLQRGQLANKYLTYRSAVPEQGWFGTAYNTFARQFEEAQQKVAGFINQLNQLIVNVNNQSRQIAQKNNRPFIDPPIPMPSFPTWPKAPNNTVRDNAQGALPQNLYDYSTQTTAANNEQFRGYFLKNVINAAQANSVNRLYVAHDYGSDCVSLARAVAYSLRWEILELDARVAIVGREFEKAGSQPTPGDPKFLKFQTQQQLDQALDNTAAQEGKKLAQSLNQNGELTDAEWNELRVNATNPAFTTAFFNAVDPKIFHEYLLVDYANSGGNFPDEPERTQILAQALASAYATGQLSSKIGQQLTTQWGTKDQPNQFLPEFLTALAKDPKASLNFVNTLTPSEISNFASGLHNTKYGSQWQGDFIEVYASAIKAAPDSTSAGTLFKTITNAVTSSTGTWNPGTNDAKALGDLIGATAAKMLPAAPSGADQADLQIWAGQVGGTFSWLLGQWMPWIKETEAGNQATNADIQGIASTIAGIAVGEIAVDTGGLGLAAWSIAAGIMQTDLTTAITSVITSPTEDPQAIQLELDGYTKDTGRKLAIMRLLQEGVVYTGKPGQEGTQVPFGMDRVNEIAQAYDNEYNAYHHIGGNGPGPVSPGPQWSIRTPDGDITTYEFLGGV